MGTVPALWALVPRSTVQEVEVGRGRLTQKQAHVAWGGGAPARAVSDTPSRAERVPWRPPGVRRAGLGAQGADLASRGGGLPRSRGGALTRTRGLWSLAPAEGSTSSPGQTTRRALGQKEQRGRSGYDRAASLLPEARLPWTPSARGRWVLLSPAEEQGGQALHSRWLRPASKRPKVKWERHTEPFLTPGRLGGP